MAEEASTEITLRDTIEQAYETHVEPPAATPAPVASPSTPAPVAAEPATATPERARDAQGRFVETPEEQAAAKKAAPAPVEIAPAAPVRVAPKPPSSWKKDYHPQWEKLDPALADYILQREGEYAKGVSTYKSEWENAKPLMEALNPYQASIQAMGIKPAQFVTNLASAHETLSRGGPEQKLSMFMKLAQDYQVPVQQLFVRGQDGQVYFNPQVQPHQAPQRQAPQAHDVAKLVRDEIAGVMSQQQIAQFAAEKDAQGNPVRPHFEAVKADMALLLDAGKAQDLNDAYRMALRMNDEIWKSEQENQMKAQEAARQEAQRKAVATAKANVVSPKSATPAGKAPADGKKGLRSTLEASFDEHLQSRV